MEMTTTERRIRVLETRLNEALARLGAAEMAIGKALQDAGNASGSGTGGANTTLYDAFVTQGIAPRNGNVLGFGYVQLVNPTLLLDDDCQCEVRKCSRQRHIGPPCYRQRFNLDG